MNTLLTILKRNWVFALILSTVLFGSVAYGKYLENNATSVSEVPSIERQLSCPVGDNYVGRLI